MSTKIYYIDWKKNNLKIPILKKEAIPQLLYSYIIYPLAAFGAEDPRRSRRACPRVWAPDAEHSALRVPTRATLAVGLDLHPLAARYHGSKLRGRPFTCIRKYPELMYIIYNARLQRLFAGCGVHRARRLSVVIRHGAHRHAQDGQ